jgi:hypothetical protein
MSVRCALLSVVVSAASLPAAYAEDLVLEAVQDTWMHGLTSSTNHGAATSLSICPAANYWIYLRFDLSGLSQRRILHAELRMTRFEGARPEEISLYFIPDDDWSESTLTGPTRPDPQNPAPATTLGRGQAFSGFDAWAPAGLVPIVEQEASGDGVLTLLVREDPSAIFDVRRFYSREGAQTDDQAPHLLLCLDSEVVGEDWQATIVGSGTKPSFDFGPDNSVHVMGMTEEHSGGVVWYATAPSPAGPWDPEVVANGYYYGPGDLRAAAGGTVHIAWHNHDTENANHAAVTEDGTTVFDIVTPGSHDGWDNSLALDAGGVLHQASVNPIAFGATESLQYGVFDGAAWNYDTVLGSGAFMYGLNTSIAVDGEGDPHIVYCMSNDWFAPGDLRYAVRRGASWEISTVVSGRAIGRFPVLVLDHWNRPHVAWLDLDPNDESRGVVRYGVLNRDEWETEDVDELSAVELGFSAARKSVSLVLDSNFRPHIAYADKRRVRYAVKPFAEWIHTTVVERAEDSYKGLVVLRLDSEERPAVVFWESHPTEPGLVRLAWSENNCPAGDCGPKLFHRGDPNASAQTDIADGIFIFTYLFLGGAAPGCLESADANNDGNVDLSDGITLLNFLFLGGQVPAAPGPPPAPCGPDPDAPGSSGDLGCASYLACT